jgi:hypothetical protein
MPDLDPLRHFGRAALGNCENAAIRESLWSPL